MLKEFLEVLAGCQSSSDLPGLRVQLLASGFWLPPFARDPLACEELFLRRPCDPVLRAGGSSLARFFGGDQYKPALAVPSREEGVLTGRHVVVYKRKNQGTRHRTGKDTDKLKKSRHQGPWVA